MPKPKGLPKPASAPQPEPVAELVYPFALLEERLTSWEYMRMSNDSLFMGDSIFIRKSAIGDNPPQRINVRIEAAD
jgi:hypothetical protein